jgi:non-ribosomal peptide synthetase component F
LRSEDFPLHYQQSKFELTLTLVDKPGQVGLWLEYSSELYRDTSMEALLEHYQRLLEAILDQPQLPIGQLPLLSPRQTPPPALAQPAPGGLPPRQDHRGPVR